MGSILLVDDNPTELDLAQRAFSRSRQFGSVEVARDTEEMVVLMQRWEAGEPEPGLILLDLNIPTAGGLEVLRKLKSHPEFKVIPVIMLTSSFRHGDISAAYQLGANSYIVKPVDYGRFIELAAQIGGYWGSVNTPPKRIGAEARYQIENMKIKNRK